MHRLIFGVFLGASAVSMSGVARGQDVRGGVPLPRAYAAPGYYGMAMAPRASACRGPIPRSLRPMARATAMATPRPASSRVASASSSGVPVSSTPGYTFGARATGRSPSPTSPAPRNRPRRSGSMRPRSGLRPLTDSEPDDRAVDVETADGLASSNPRRGWTVAGGLAVIDDRACRPYIEAARCDRPSPEPTRLDHPSKGPRGMSFPPLRPRPAIDPPAPGGGRRRHGPPADPREPKLRERVPAGGTIAVGVGSRGITAIADDRAGGRRHAQGDGLPARSSSPRWAATAARPPRASASCSPATAITPEAMGVEVRTDMDTRGPRHQPGRPADLLRQERPRGRRDRPAEPGQAAHRLPRGARVGHPEDAGHRPGQAARGPSQVHKLGLRGLQRGPAGRRPVPGREHQVRARPGDPGERRGPARRDRRGRARDDLRRRAAACSSGPAA